MNMVMLQLLIASYKTVLIMFSVSVPRQEPTQHKYYENIVFEKGPSMEEN